MLWPGLRLLIAEKETKGYEWADTYLEGRNRPMGYYPTTIKGKASDIIMVFLQQRARLQENQVCVSRVDMGCLHRVKSDVWEKVGTKKVNFDLLDSCPPSPFHPHYQDNKCSRTGSLFIYNFWVLDQSDGLSAFLPPISGLSVLTGEKTTMPIWKICSDNIIVSPGCQDTHDCSIWWDFEVQFRLTRKVDWD